MQINGRITQKRFGNRLTFEFEPERLLYAWRDVDGERRFPIAYETIDVTSPSTATISNREFIQRMLLVPLVMWVLSMVLASSNPVISRILFDLAAGLAVILLMGKFFGIFAVRFAELPLTLSPAGASELSLRVIRNRDCDAVLAELNSRWKTRMKEIHGAVDYSNDTDRELDKFRWLKQHQVIDEAEFTRISEQLRTYASIRARPLPSEGTIN